MTAETYLFAGVHGRVFDLCRPSERRFNTAVKIVLGRNTDSIVVDHEETAIQCIDVSGPRRILPDSIGSHEITFPTVPAPKPKWTSDLYPPRYYPGEAGPRSTEKSEGCETRDRCDSV